MGYLLSLVETNMTIPTSNTKEARRNFGFMVPLIDVRTIPTRPGASR